MLFYRNLHVSLERGLMQKKILVKISEKILRNFLEISWK